MYFMRLTGELCGTCGHKLNRKPVDCSDEDHKQYYARVRRLATIYIKIHPRKKTPEQNKRSNLKYNYGLTVEEFEALWQQQKGLCAICKKVLTKETGNGFVGHAVDHNHKTNRVRGLLCNRCNILVGFLEKKDLIEVAMKYLGETND